MNTADLRPFSIRIFLPDGHPDGLRIVEKSNWTGKGVVFPRPILPDKKTREEFNQTGVYVLVGPSEEGDLPTIYVGEGDPVRPRLEQHYSQKDFWTWAVFFVSKDSSLNKAHIQHLEARLIQLANEARRAKLDNHVSPQLPALSEAETADVESFLMDMLSIFPLLGLTAFEKAQLIIDKREILYIKSKGITAKGYETGQGFVVLSGSQLVKEEVPSISRTLSDFRKDLLTQGVIKLSGMCYEFLQNYVFSSPSTASGVILGNATNGRITWKSETGMTLKEIQEAETQTEL